MTTKKAGRPPKGAHKRQRVTIYLRPDLIEWVDEQRQRRETYSQFIETTLEKKMKASQICEQIQAEFYRIGASDEEPKRGDLCVGPNGDRLEFGDSYSEIYTAPIEEGEKILEALRQVESGEGLQEAWDALEPWVEVR